MNSQLPEQADNPEGILLAGTVAGVDACSLVSNAGTIVVGSALDCDLTVTDPLVPARAFRLCRAAGGQGWLIEAFRNARVYVNGELTDRDRIRFGDRVTVGCHHFQFKRQAPAVRARTTSVNIRDLCERLVAATEVPAAFLRSCPSYLGRARVRQATQWAAIMLALVAAMFLIYPPVPTFVNIQPPMDVVMVGDVTMAPSPSAVKGLVEAKRQEVRPPSAEFQQPDLASRETPSVKPEQTGFATADAISATPFEPAARTPGPAVSAGPELSPVALPAPNRARIDVSRSIQDLAEVAPRRLSMEEAADPNVQHELERLNVQIQTAPAMSAGFRTRSSVIQETAPRTAETIGAPGVEKALTLLVANQPSPLKFEQYKGARIPVARMPENLNPLAVHADEPGIQFDGQVSDGEIAVSWKSGRFRIHGPNPQPAEPPTFCYVGKTTRNGKECLYVSFVCEDPNVANLRGGSTTGIWRDDSVEVFVDVNEDRRDYHQLIVNFRGQYVGYYCANSDQGINARGSPWDARPEIKTVVNAEAKRWTAEILIPFSSLGGVPAKGSRWAVNFTRAFRGQTFPDSVYQNWFLVYNGKAPNYHNPELFGIFQW